MSRSYIIFLLMFGAIASSVFAQGSTIEFSPEQIYVVPGIDKIDEALFNDIDHDGVPEILVRRANHIQVYSKSEGSILFQTDIDTAKWRGIVFADINRDSVVDIAVACFHDCRDHSDSALTIDLYNGAAGNAVTRYYYPNAERTWGLWLIYSAKLTAFKAFDVNSDGYDELLISHCNWIWDGGAGPPAHIWYERQFATSKIFHSFPDSIMWHGARQLADPAIVSGENGSFLMANNLLKYSEGSITDSYYQRNSVLRFDTDYSGVYMISDSVLRYGSDKNICITFTSTQSLLMKCAGDLIGSNGGREFLASFYFLWDCYEYGELGPEPDSSGSEMRMYHMASPESAELVWTHGSEPYADYIFLPDYPGNYFAFYNNQLIQLDGVTGLQTASSQQIPPGSGHWDYPFRDGQPYRIVFRADTATIYRVDIVTDASDVRPPPLPATLSLGKPYPNPFNATQTVPVTVQPGHELTVAVYNLLGQKVETIYQGTPSATELNLVWRADNLASGIYFVRAISGDDIAVVRSILLK